MTAHVCGIDFGKTVFHLVGLSKEGHFVVKKRFSRQQLLTCTANMPVCLIGMEACSGAHFWPGSCCPKAYRQADSGRVCSPFREVEQERLCRCEAIAGAVQWPTMRFAPIKNEAQLDMRSAARFPSPRSPYNTLPISSNRAKPVSSLAVTSSKPPPGSCCSRAAPCCSTLARAIARSGARTRPAQSRDAESHSRPPA